MSANVQKNGMVAVGAKTWHGNEILLEVAPKTAAELMAKFAPGEGLNFEVGLEPLLQQVERDGIVDFIETEMNAIARKDNHKVLGYAMGRYDVMQPRELVEWCQPLVDSGCYKFETAGAIGDGEKVFVLLRVADREIVPGDKVRNYLLITSGNDGRTPTIVGRVSIRVVCANTLAVALGEEDNTWRKVKHTSAQRLTLEQIREAYLRDVAAFDAQAEWFKKLLARPVLTHEREAFVSNVIIGRQAEDKMTNRKQLRDARVQEFISKLADGMADGDNLPGVHGTAYGLLQAASQFIEREQGGDKVKNRQDNILFGQGARTMRAAEDELNVLLAAPVGGYGAVALA